MARNFEGLNTAKLVEAFQASNPYETGIVEILKTPKISEDVIEVFYNFDNVDPRLLVKNLREAFPEIKEIRITYPAGSVAICKCYASDPPAEERPDEKKHCKDIEIEIESLIDSIVKEVYNEELAYRSVVAYEDVAKVEVYTRAPKLGYSDLYLIFSSINKRMKEKGYKFETNKNDEGLYRWVYRK